MCNRAAPRTFNAAVDELLRALLEPVPHRAVPGHTSSPRPCAQRVRSVCVSEVVRARDISECKQADHAE